MRNHTIEVGDRSGHAFKIHISTPSAWEEVKSGLSDGWQDYDLHMTGWPVSEPFRAEMVPGNWRVLDLGFIRYSSGKVLRKVGPDRLTIDIYLANLDSTWGMKFFEYEGKFGGVNDEGEGFVVQPWVLGIGVGRFSWSLVD